MPWLPIYADEEDFRAIHERLNLSREIAFIVPDGPKSWRAVRSLPGLEAARICLWHVPGGPLQLPHPYPSREVDTIADPWSTWTGLADRGHPGYPFFGADEPAVIWLNHYPQSCEISGGIGLSSFEWIGNLYSTIGSPAPAGTEKFWQGLRRWVRQSAIKIPRYGPVDGPEPEIWAFPSALGAFRRGRLRDSNPGW